jgi:division protein CdvB (Snf7/Vps24/ESCRT-III family)
LISKWTNSGKGGNLTRRVIDKVRPEVPLKNKINVAQKKLELQIAKLDAIHTKLQKNHDKIFQKIVQAQRTNNQAYAKMCAVELAEVRKMKSMVGNSKLSMEQINLRLNTVSDMGDIVVTLSPCMSLVKGLGSSLGGIMPEASTSMQDLSQILGDVLSSSSMDGGGTSMYDNDVSMINDMQQQQSPEANAILKEAYTVVKGRTESMIPDVPSNLKDEIIHDRKTTRQEQQPII